MKINERSRNTAKILIDIGAINFSLVTPFRLSSGFLSPSYIDCRKIIAYPSAFKSITDMMIDTIKSDMSPLPDYIIGGETAGIPFSAVIAEKMGLPLSYVRKKAKDYGKNKLIEGDILKEKNTLLVEDLMTDGKSKINFVENIRSHGIECNLSLVVFRYNIFKEADISMKRNNIKVYHLTDWEEVYNQMHLMNTFESSILLEIRKFLDDPVAWSNHKNRVTKI